MDIGFIGLGNMGGPMAANLAAAGHRVTGFDLCEVVVDGVVIAGSGRRGGRSRGCDHHASDGDALRAVADHILPVMTGGCGFVDCSTVDVASARAVAVRASAAGMLPVDAPVSGGVGGAQGGTLTFMAGGSEDAFAGGTAVAVMGQKAVHCGDSGAGQAAKICNNMILGATMIVTCRSLLRLPTGWVLIGRRCSMWSALFRTAGP